MTKFLERKPSKLGITRLPSINLEPTKNHLSISQTNSVEITPEKKQRNFSIMNVCSTEIPPDPYPCMYCMLVPPRPNYPEPKPTDPLCSVCSRPIDDRFNPQTCCNQMMHEHCWGEHPCDGWTWYLGFPLHHTYPYSWDGVKGAFFPKNIVCVLYCTCCTQSFLLMYIICIIEGMLNKWMNEELT